MFWALCFFFFLRFNIAAKYEWIGGPTQLWSVSSSWLTGIVPGNQDSVFFPMNSGQVFFNHSVQVQSLEMNGGVQFVAQNTTCPSGWSPYIVGLKGTKCLKVINTATDFYSAEQQCVIMGGGAPESKLVQISNYDQLNYVKRLCRAVNTLTNMTRNATVPGCWIGLKMDTNVAKDPILTDRKNYFSWVSGNGEEEGGGTPGYGPPSLGSLVPAFRDWRRYEPDNHTLSEGQYDVGGENCVQLIPWDQDPLVLNEGSWNDDGCELLKPYVCQMMASTQQFQVTVANALIYDGGMVGGELIVSGQATITKFNASNGAVISLLGAANSAASTISRYLHLQSGSSLRVYGKLRVNVGALIGEAQGTSVNTPFSHPWLWDHTGNSTPYALNFLGLQPLVSVYSTGNITVVNSATNSPQDTVFINAAMDVQSGGSLIMTGTGKMYLAQGGNLSAATVVVQNTNSRLELGGYSSTLFSYDAVDLTLSSVLPVVGETNSSQPKMVSGHSVPTTFNYGIPTPLGVYRLKVELSNCTVSRGCRTPTSPKNAVLRRLLAKTGYQHPATFGTMIGFTRCLPYNASSIYIANALNKLSIVSKRGNVTVRSYGKAWDPAFSYGYTHRIEMDAPPTKTLSLGSLRITIGCYGSSNCSCAESKVMVRPDTAPYVRCGKKADRTLFDGTISPDLLCAIPPRLTVTPITTLSQIQTVGLGQVVVLGGVHRMAPVMSTAVTVAVMGGGALVANDAITWSSALIGGTGTLAVAGLGWAGWDSLMSVGQAEWTTYRGFTALLDNAPPFSFNLLSFSVYGNGSVFTAAPTSNITWGSGLWLSGTIGGRSTITVTGTIAMLTGAVRYLRMGCTLRIAGTMRWGGGTVGLSEGANVLIDGQAYIFGNYTGSTAGGNLIMGQSELIGLNLDYSGPNFLVQELQYYQALMNPPPPVNATTPNPSMQPTSRPSNASMYVPPPPPPVNGTSWAWNVTSTLAITDVLMNFMGSYSAGQQWHGYYDQDLPAQLKGGWYKDPLCGDRCTLQSNVTLGKRAHVYVGTNCSQWLGPVNHKLVATSKNKTTCGTFTVNFLSPLIMRDKSSFRVGDTAQVMLFSGGWCQSNASFNTSVSGWLELAGGQMKMTEGCKVWGHPNSNLVVSGGWHDIAKVVQPVTTIKGGVLTWPSYRSKFSNLTFAGGLIVEQTGQLLIYPLGVTVVVGGFQYIDPNPQYGTGIGVTAWGYSIGTGLYVHDQGTIQFPIIGMTLEHSFSDDQQRAPDNANTPDPGGRLIALDGMHFYGGTLRGKSSFFIHNVLYLGGMHPKRVEQQADLVNVDHAEYGGGDIHFRDNGVFTNLGTIQSMTAVTTGALSPIGVNVGTDDPTSQFQMLYAGTEKPAGATNNFNPDMFRQYHAWDSDVYHLNYTVYGNGLGNSMSYAVTPGTVNLEVPLPQY